MKNNSILCPSCKTEIELTEVVAGQIRAELNAEIEGRRKQLEQSFSTREGDLRAKIIALQKERETLDETVKEKTQLERARLLIEMRKEAQSELAIELRDLREQIKNKGDKLAEAQKAQLEFLKKEQALEEQKQTLELDLQKRLLAEREKLQQQAREFALEENQLKLADKEKTISEMREQIAALSLKASKASQQLQGEVLEERFEAMLRQEFPFDEITPVKTGARGADLRQTVRTANGSECGAILWEIKRTAAFQKAWIPKLKEDQREESADFAVLLTQSMPDDCEHFGQREGIWITSYTCGLSLALALRQSLIQLSAARRAAVGQKEKTAVLYNYLCSLEFRQTVEALVGNYLSLSRDLDRERAAMEKLWASRSKQLGAMISNTACIYGSLQGIVGASALPEIPTLTLEPAEDSMPVIGK